jgi:dTDP-6-deoxy-L-talose 4-dehydrogenase (NAD+)
MRKVLVTGATGFIGNYVVNELLNNENIIVIATSRSEKKAQASDWFDKVTYIPYDLEDEKDSLFDFFGSPESIIHLAWDGLPNYKSSIHIDKNLYLNYKFLNTLVNEGISDLNVVGTCFEYGMQDGCLSEEMSSNPTNAYAIAKDSLRKFLENNLARKSITFKWMRLFYMYGSGQSNTSLLAQLEDAIKNKADVFNMSGGEQLRDFLPVREMAKAIVDVSAQSEITGIINCSSGKPISVRKLVEDYLKMYNSDIRLNLGYYSYPDYEPMAFWGNNNKLNLVRKKDFNE